MIEKINPTIPIPIESSSIPDEQREITIAKSSIAIPNPIFFIVNPSFGISNWTKSLSLLKIISLENYVVILFQTLFLMKSIFFHKKRPGTEIDMLPLWKTVKYKNTVNRKGGIFYV